MLILGKREQIHRAMNSILIHLSGSLFLKKFKKTEDMICCSF